MHEYMQHFWHTVLYCFKKGKTHLKHKKRLFCAGYGEGAVTDRMCYTWFAKFCAGGFSLDNASWLGRPIEIDSDQIKTLIETNQCNTMWEIDNILKISRSVKLLVKLKKMCLLFYRKNETDFLANSIYIKYISIKKIRKKSHLAKFLWNITVNYSKIICRVLLPGVSHHSILTFPCILHLKWLVSRKA